MFTKDVYVSTRDMASHVQLGRVLSHIWHWVTTTMIMILNSNLTTKFSLLSFHIALCLPYLPLATHNLFFISALAYLLCIWNSFFLLMKSIPYCGCATIWPFIHSFIHWGTYCQFTVFTTNKSTVNICVQTSLNFKITFWNLVSMQLLAHPL